jgi:hypothetical protein
MSVEVIEGNLTGFEGITHYKRRREELIGGALVDGISGITPYRRHRAERDGYRGESAWPELQAEVQNIASYLQGITHYRERRMERDGWQEREGFPASSLVAATERAEVEDQFVNAPAVNGLGDAIMTLEGLDHLFNFPKMPLEALLTPSEVERRVMPSAAWAGLDEAAEAGEPKTQQVMKLNELLDKRRSVITTSDARIVEMLRRVRALDDEINALIKQHDEARKSGDTKRASAIEKKAFSLDRKRTLAAKRALRYAKLRTLAMTLARNVRAQIDLAQLVGKAEKQGDKAVADVLKQAFSDIGKTTDKIHAIREEQASTWKARDAAQATPMSGFEAADPDVVRRDRKIKLGQMLSLIVRELKGWQKVAKVRALTKDEAQAIRNIQARYAKLMAEWRKLGGGPLGEMTIPAVWEVGDIKAGLRKLYGRIATLKAQGAREDQLRPYYQKAYNLRRMAQEQHAQGLTGLDGFLSKIGGALKSAAGSVYGGAKTAVTKVAQTGTKLGKFAACGVLAKPGVAAAVGTVAAPGGGTAAGAAAGSVLASACGGGQGGVQAAQQAGVDPGYVQQATGQRPSFFRPRNLLIIGGVVAAGAAGFMVLRRRKTAAMAALADIYSQYGFSGEKRRRRFGDIYSQYGFSAARRRLPPRGPGGKFRKRRRARRK